jgi:hypothetical protein
MKKREKIWLMLVCYQKERRYVGYASVIIVAATPPKLGDTFAVQRDDNAKIERFREISVEELRKGFIVVGFPES